MQIEGRIVNHQQTRVYTLFAIRSFPVKKFSVYFQKKVRIQIFPFVMREVIALRTVCAHNFMRV